jgi:hypothetical protein
MLDKWIRDKNGLVNATEIVRLGNEMRQVEGERRLGLRTFLGGKTIGGLKEYAEEVYGEKVVVVKGQGGNRVTWVHPIIALELTCIISTKVKYDCLKMIQEGFIWGGDK